MFVFIVLCCGAILFSSSSINCHPASSSATTTNLQNGHRIAKRQAPSLELVDIGNQKYYFSNIDHKLNWESARQYCKSNGLELTTIDTEQENQLVNKHAQRLYDRKNWGIWLGGSDTASERNWVWDATQQVLSYTNFDAEQPGGGPAENCLLMHRSDGRWNDFDCNRDFNFICKKSGSAALQENVIQLELIPLGSNQFYFSNQENKVNWEDAKKFCQHHGLKFATIESEAENKLVNAYMQRLYDRKLWGAWLGASDSAKEGDWRWDSTQQPLTFTQFDADQPGGGPAENCLLMHRSDGHWNDFDCTREFMFVCKKKNDGTGAVGTEGDKIHFEPQLELVKLGKHQFYFSNRDNKLKWSGAQEFCKSNNLEFARINSARENGLVLSYAQKLYERRLWGIWLGSSDSNAEGNWLWDFTQQPLKYHNWDADQPGGGPKENCLLLHRSDGAWNDFDCDREFNFICKKSAPESVLLTAEPTVDLIELGEFQYYFSPKDQRLSWSDARTFCQNNGLELTSVENAEQNKQIHDQVKKMHRTYSPWLGASDMDEEGRWIWDATKLQLKYSNWWTYQPDGATIENCLYMFSDDGKWGDKKCEYTKPFVCQKYE